MFCKSSATCFEKSDIDIANYADGETPHASSLDLDCIFNKLQKNIEIIFK